MNLKLRGPRPLACYVGYSQNKLVNQQAASGGVVSQIILNHLLSGGVVITPQFDPSTLMYRVVEIKKPSDYVVAASIYHDVELVQSIKSFTLCSSLRYLVTCLPCEASFVRNFFSKNNASVVIVALACSGQQSYSATNALLRMSGLKKATIKSLKYRGEGWPSGLQVTTKTGRIYTFPNLKGLWYNIFNSQLFTLEKCFTCTDVLGKNADITCADPWLPEFMESEEQEISYTLIFIRRGLKNFYFDNIKLTSIDIDRAILSQRYTISRKEKQLSKVSYVKLFLCARTFLIPVFTSKSFLLKLFRITYSNFWKFVS